jgi:hypothetical protein
MRTPSYESAYPPVRHARFTQGHHLVVIDPIEAFLKIKVNHSLISSPVLSARFVHGLMGGSSRPESITELREPRVPFRLDHVQDRLLYQPIEYRHLHVLRWSFRMHVLHPQIALAFKRQPALDTTGLPG